MSKSLKQGPGRTNPNAAAFQPHDEIGTKLREMYAEVENEAIPADLIELLERLDAAEERDGK